MSYNPSHNYHDEHNTLSRRQDGRPDMSAYLIIGALAAIVGFLGVVATVGATPV